MWRRGMAGSMLEVKGKELRVVLPTDVCNAEGAALVVVVKGVKVGMEAYGCLNYSHTAISKMASRAARTQCARERRKLLALMFMVPLTVSVQHMELYAARLHAHVHERSLASEVQNAVAVQVGGSLVDPISLALDIQLSQIRADASIPLCFVQLKIPALNWRLDLEELVKLALATSPALVRGGGGKGVGKEFLRSMSTAASKSRLQRVMARQAQRAQTGRTPCGNTPSIRCMSVRSNLSDISSLQLLERSSPQGQESGSRQAGSVPSRDWLDSSVHAALSQQPGALDGGQSLLRVGSSSSFTSNTPSAPSPSQKPATAHDLPPEAWHTDVEADTWADVARRPSMSPDLKDAQIFFPVSNDAQILFPVSNDAQTKGANDTSPASRARAAQEAGFDSAAEAGLASAEHAVDTAAPDQLLATVSEAAGTEVAEALSVCVQQTAMPPVVMDTVMIDQEKGSTGTTIHHASTAETSASARPSEWAWRNVLAWRRGKEAGVTFGVTSQTSSCAHATGLDATKEQVLPDGRGEVQVVHAPTAAVEDKAQGRWSWLKSKVPWCGASGSKDTDKQDADAVAGAEAAIEGVTGTLVPATQRAGNGGRSAASVEPNAPVPSPMLSPILQAHEPAKAGGWIVGLDLPPSAAATAGADHLVGADKSTAKESTAKESTNNLSLNNSSLKQTLERSLQNLNTLAGKRLGAESLNKLGSRVTSSLFKGASHEQERQQVMEREAARKVLALPSHTRRAAYTAMQGKGYVWHELSWRQRLEACNASRVGMLRRYGSLSSMSVLIDPDALPRLRERHKGSFLVLPDREHKAVSRPTDYDDILDHDHNFEIDLCSSDTVNRRQI